MTSHWPRVRLGDLLRRTDDIVSLAADIEYREITVKLWGKGVVPRRVVTGTSVAGQRRFVAHSGDFILSRIDARNGAFGFVPPSLHGAVVSNDFPLFRLNQERLLPSFLAWLSRTAGFVEMCQKASEGTTNRVRLQERRFLALEITLPPLPEQQRIVARIEELAAQIEEAYRFRQHAREQAEALRIASLRAAILSCPSEEIELGAACDALIDNLHSNPRYSADGVPCVRSPDVGWGTIFLDTARRTAEDEYRRRTVRGEPQPDDIVFVREGGGTGKCALVLSGQRFSLGQRVMMLRPNRRLVEPRFFLYQLLSPLVQEDQITPLSKGSASPHLNIGALRRFRFRLPSLVEQRRIAACVEGTLAEVDALRYLQTHTAAELNALLPAILDKAFKGEL